MEAQNTMADAVDWRDYPLDMTAFPFLCDRERWIARRDAHRAWMQAAKHIHPELRASVSRQLSVHGHYEYWVNRGTLAQEQILLHSGMSAAFDLYDDACLAARRSTLARIYQGEIDVIARRRDPPGPWERIDGEWIESGDYRLDLPRRDIDFWKRGPKFHHWRGPGRPQSPLIRLRVNAPLPFDQAMMVYGNREIAYHLDRLWRGGALDVGTSIAPGALGKTGDDIFWARKHRELLLDIQAKLESGQLAGWIDGVEQISAAWRDVDLFSFNSDLWGRISLGMPSGSSRAEGAILMSNAVVEQGMADIPKRETESKMKSKGGRKPDPVRRQLLDEVYADIRNNNTQQTEAIKKVLHRVPGKVSDEQSRIKWFARELRKFPAASQAEGD